MCPANGLKRAKKTSLFNECHLLCLTTFFSNISAEIVLRFVEYLERTNGQEIINASRVVIYKDRARKQ